MELILNRLKQEVILNLLYLMHRCVRYLFSGLLSSCKCSFSNLNTYRNSKILAIKMDRIEKILQADDDIEKKIMALRCEVKWKPSQLKIHLYLLYNKMVLGQRC